MCASSWLELSFCFELLLRQGVLEVLLELPPEPSEPPSDRHTCRLFEFFHWSDRAEKLGLRLSRYGTRVFALRRESDDELMADELTWEQTTALIGQLKGKHS